MSDERFGFAPQWQGLRGMAFGLQQPALIGTAWVRDVEAADLARLEDLALQSPRVRLRSLEASTELAHRFVFRVLDWIGAVQRVAGVPVAERVHLQALGASAEQPRRMVFRVALPTASIDANRLAIRWVGAQARRLLSSSRTSNESAAQAEPTAAGLHDQLRAHAEPGLNRFHILQAAQRLDIPVQQLTYKVKALGTGAHARLLSSSITEHTSNIGVNMAASKSQTAAALRSAGLPGATHLPALGPHEAVAAAATIGYPVVVKPDDQEQGRGVMADLVSPSDVAAAFTTARKHSERILIEKWIDGLTHRLTVFRGRVIRIVKRVPGGVTGDGQHSIEALVEARARAQAEDPASPFARSPAVTLDEEALGLLTQKGLSPQHVPAAGVHVRLRRRDNVNAGGRNQEITLAEVHPDNLRLARDAAAVMRLDFAGVDLISTDIGTSWIDNGAAICEVNAQPQLGVSGESRIYETILAELMQGRFGIPVQVVLGPGDAALQQRVLEQCLAASRGAAVSAAAGLWIGGRRATPAFQTAFDAARALLLRPEVDSAVCIMPIDEVCASGFPIHRVDSVSVALRDLFSADDSTLLGQALPMLVSSRGALS